MRGYSAEQVRAAERAHLDAGEPLMARAAEGLAHAVLALLAAEGRPAATSHVCVLAGSGDNGGDALYAAASLAAHGAAVTVVPVGSRLHDGGRTAAVLAGATLLDRTSGSDEELVGRAVDACLRADLVIDGIIGTGTSPEPALRGLGRAIVVALLADERLSAERPLIVAVDLPSGVHPDTGAASDDAVLPADLTVTFGGAKAGLLIGAGAALSGRIEVVPIGIEDDLAALTPVVET
jgi:NAD(P)H-hydrate epimerase